MAHRQDALWSPEKDRGIFFWLFLFGAAFILALKDRPNRPPQHALDGR